MICQHCRRRTVSRPRQLCWQCFHAPGVRDLYPLSGKFHQHASVSDGRCTGRAALPTSALPGSLEKVLVMCRRADLGQELFHPDDATIYGPISMSKAG